MVVAVVVEVDDPVELGLGGHVDVVGVGDALGQGLAGVLLHLDVVELPKGRRKENRVISYHPCCLQVGKNG